MKVTSRLTYLKAVVLRKQSKDISRGLAFDWRKTLRGSGQILILKNTKGEVDTQEFALYGYFPMSDFCFSVHINEKSK